MTSTISVSEGKETPVLLMGAAGRLGDMVVKHWPDGVKLMPSARQAHPEFIQLDPLVDPDGAARKMQGIGPVICLAGVTPMRVAQKGDVFSRNTDVALATLRAASAAGAGRVFVASTAAVYGGTRGVLNEAADLMPPSEYGQAKLEMERAASALARRLGHPLTVLRIGNVAGADAILGGWCEGFTLDQLPGGNTPRRSYIGPRSLAEVLHHLAQVSDLPEVLNISAPGSVEMGALLDAADLAWAPRPATQATLADVTLCTKRLETYAPFAPEDATPQGLVAQWRAYQSFS